MFISKYCPRHCRGWICWHKNTNGSKYSVQMTAASLTILSFLQYLLNGTEVLDISHNLFSPFVNSVTPCLWDFFKYLLFLSFIRLHIWKPFTWKTISSRAWSTCWIGTRRPHWISREKVFCCFSPAYPCFDVLSLFLGLFSCPQIFFNADFMV